MRQAERILFSVKSKVQRVFVVGQQACKKFRKDGIE